MNKEFSDEAFFSGMQRNKEHALKMLYKSFYPMALNFILKNNGTEEEAKDVYQEAVIIFYEKIEKGFTLTCKIKTFIYSVCRRQWLKRLYEKSKFPGRINDMEEFIQVENDLKEEDYKEKDFDLMSQSLGKLGEPCRTLIEDFYIREMTMEDIAEKFGYTNSDNAKNQKYKCLQRLKKLFFGSYKDVEL